MADSQIMKDVARSIYKLVRLNRVATLVANCALPLIVAVVGANYDSFGKGYPFLFWLIELGLIAVTLSYSYFTWDIRLAPEVYMELENAEQETLYLIENVQYLAVLQNQVLSWNAMTRQALAQKINNREDLITICRKICAPIVDMRKEYFAFDGLELWNFALYLWNDETRLLEPIWREKAPNHPSTGIGRSWADGVGHVGHAFLQRRQIVTGDVGEALGDFVAGNERQPYDQQTYVSCVSRPISSSDPNRRPYGVLVATSDRADRFDETNSIVLAHTEAVLATVLEAAYIEAT